MDKLEMSRDEQMGGGGEQTGVRGRGGGDERKGGGGRGGEMEAEELREHASCSHSTTRRRSALSGQKDARNWAGQTLRTMYSTEETPPAPQGP